MAESVGAQGSRRSPGSGSIKENMSESCIDITGSCSSVTHVRAGLIWLQQSAWLLVFWESCCCGRENYSWIKKKERH